MDANKPQANTLKVFFEVYDSIYRPPEWLKMPDLQEFIWQYADMVTIYYNKLPGITEKIARKAAEKRIPTYIPNKQPYLTYNRQSLQYHYKYTDEHLDFKGPAEVNIALFCITPTFPDLKYIHILAVYGPKMHTMQCPDYKYLSAVKSLEIRQHKYTDMVADCFRKIRAVFVSKGYRRLIIHGFGGMGQSRILLECLELNPVKIFRKLAYKYLADLFKPADPLCSGRELLFNELGEVFPDSEIESYFGANVGLNWQQTTLNTDKYTTHASGDNKPPIRRPIVRSTHIPISELVEQLDQAELDKTLVIINWDRYSILGNGHRHDNSLAGKLGSISAVSLLSYPFTNPGIQYVGITTANKIEPQSI